MARRAPLAALLVLGIVPLCGARAFYETSHLQLRSFEGASNAQLAAAIEDDMGHRGVRTLTVIGADGRETQVLPREGRRDRRLQEVERRVLVGTLIALSHPLRGAEWDLLVPVGPQRVPATVWFGDSDLRAEGGTAARPRPQMSAQDFATTWPDLVLTQDDRRWDDQSRGLVDAALTLLTPTDRARIMDVEFVRAGAASPETSARLAPEGGGFDAISASFQHDEHGRRIWLFDGAVPTSPSLFTGSPRAPLPGTVLHVLHELAHALAFADARHEALSPAAAAYEAVRGDEPSGTEYGRTHPEEGFAEAFALFHADPDALLRVQPVVHAWFTAGCSLPSPDAP